LNGARGQNPFGRDALLHPLLEHRQHVEGVGSRSAATVRHARRHEQPVETLQVLERRGAIPTGADE
jgi:hypothetical protein